MQMQLVARFGYGPDMPWVRKCDGRLLAVAGPDGMDMFATLPSATPLRGCTTVADFTVSEGQRLSFSLTWFESYGKVAERCDAGQALDDATEWWLRSLGRTG